MSLKKRKKNKFRVLTNFFGHVMGTKVFFFWPYYHWHCPRTLYLKLQVVSNYITDAHSRLT